MNFRIADDDYPEVEIREIKVGQFFEYKEEVYKRVKLSNCIILDRSKENLFYIMRLKDNEITYFSSNASNHEKATLLYELSPLLLTRRQP